MKLLIAVFLTFSLNYSIAQRSLLFGVHADAAIPLNQYGQHRDVLRSRLLSHQFNFGAFLGARLWNRIGLEAGITQNIQSWKMRDKAFAKRNDGFQMNLLNKNFYYSLYGNLQFLQKLNEGTFLYLQGGYNINFVGADKLNSTKKFVKGNETITANTIYSSQNNSFSGEIGIQKFSGTRHFFSFGLKMNFGRQDFLNGTYTVNDGTQDITNDSYTSQGSYSGLTVKYCYIFAHADKKEKKPKPPKEDPVIPDVPVVHKDTVKSDSIPKKLEGRDIEVTHKVTVTNRKVTIKVWDHQKVDGDRISINLNGKWILINYTLQKQQRVIEVELDEGSNVFVLHALNLGKYEPNTAAIIIDDGVKENKIILESTLKTSGTVQITVAP